MSVVGPGEVGELANTFRDMTEQIRRRERDLREKLAWMDTILANAADGIMTFDQTGRIEQANRAAEEMFGYGHGKLEGEKVKQLMPISERINKPAALALAGDNYGGTVARLWSAVKTPGEEHRGRRKDGTSFWMEVTFSRVPLEDRSIVTAIFRDITRRKLDEERIRKLNDDLEARVKLRTAQLEDTKTKLELALAEAENASAAKDRFISVVSHELRTPLTSAMGYTELLLNPRAERLRQAPMPTLAQDPHVVQAPADAHQRPARHRPLHRRQADRPRPEPVRPGRLPARRGRDDRPARQAQRQRAREPAARRRSARSSTTRRACGRSS